MEKHTVSFRLDADKVTALDTLAEAQDRDRTYLLNEAVAAYLEVQRWQMEQIKKSLNQADNGDLLPHSKIKKAVRSWRRR
jgi:predicted transcriptional regulator